MSFSHSFFIVVAGLFLLLSIPLEAAERAREMESARFKGRGGTYVAAFDSDDATRGNPATLAEPKLTFQMRWAQMDLFLGENVIDTVQDLTEIAGDDGVLDIIDQFRDKFGKRQYGKFQFSPLAMRIFSVELAPVFYGSSYIDMRKPTMPEAIMRTEAAAGVNIAIAFPFGKELFVGTNLRPLYRSQYNFGLVFGDLMSFIDDSSAVLDDVYEHKEGFVFGLDVGAIWTPSKQLRLGATVENLGYAGQVGDFVDPPPEIPQRFNLGMLYRIDMKTWKLDFLLDGQDLINPNQYNYFRLIHGGVELGTSYFSRDTDLGVMSGINEGYFTMGAYVDAWLARLTASYYAVELGEFPGQRKDRRYAFSLVSSMTF